jgi:SRSO17 transposase
VLVIDDSGDRKDGKKTAHVGRQWLGRYGKTDNGVVTVTTLWADEQVYYPMHAVPYTLPGISPRERTTRSSGPSCRSARTWPSCGVSEVRLACELRQCADLGLGGEAS